MSLRTRRQVLAGGATALVASLAGCGLVTDRLQWMAGSGQTTTPTAVDDMLYLGINKPNQDTGTLAALNRSDGSTNWEYQTTGNVESQPAAVDGTVYAGDSEGALYAVTDGSEDWSFTKPFTSVGTPAITDNTVYAKGGPLLFAVNRKSGEEEWRFETVGSEYPRPAVASDMVYIRSNGSVYAVDRASGTEQWVFDGGGNRLTLVDDTIYIGDSDTGALIALDRMNGDVRWKETGAPAKTPIAAGQHLYTGDSKQFASYTMQGDRAWRTEFSNVSTTGIPTVAHDSVYVTTSSKDRGEYLRSLTQSNGDSQWKKLLDHPSLGAPATSKNHIYVPGNRGLYSLTVKPKLALF